MKGLTKLKKLLCFLIVSIFVFGFGGEIAKADSFTSKGQLQYLGDYFQWKYNTTKGLDAYCLDSASLTPAPVGGSRELIPASNITDVLPADKVDSIIKILKASEGLNLDEGKRYYVTQAAIWYTLDGIYYTGHQNGIANSFYNKITSTSPYKEAWETLINASMSSDPINSNTILSIDAQNNSLTVDGDYLVSKDITLNIASNVSVMQQSPVPSEGACILYNGQCTTTATIPANTTFKVRVNKPAEGSGQVQMGIEAVSSETYSNYDIDGYVGITTTVGKIQSLVTLRKESKTVSHARKFVGNYDNATEVQIQKTDLDTGDRVAGAKLQITDENGVIIGTYTSTAGEDGNPRVSLPDGKYYLSELSQPTGYYYSSKKVEFNIVDENGTKVVKDADGNTITPTISFSNKARKIKFRKLDSEGNPMAGIKFIIYSYGAERTAEANGYTKEQYKLCAITDANGYLTQPCSGEDFTNNVRSDGEYRIGLEYDFGKDGDIFHIHEYCETAACKPYLVPGTTTGEVYGTSQSVGASIQIFNSGERLISVNDVDQNSFGTLFTTYTSGENPVVTINIVNKYHINISKTDVTGGAEIPGAQITVTDPSLQFGESDLQTDAIIDSWESTTEPHTIMGIVPGVKYRLTEEVAPEGFVKMVNSIDFIMDKDGNVTTYDIETGEAITDLTGSDYHLLITNAPTKTIFSKTSAVSGEEIAGAQLKVCSKESYDAAKAATGDGNNCESFVIPYSGQKVEWVSEAGKSKIVDALPAGDYYLVESIAPEGYAKQTNSASFTVKTDGSISKVELKNEPTKVVISKKDITTEGEIEGAQLKICTLDDYNNDGSDCKPARDDLSWVSGKEPTEFELLPIGDYVLIETIPAPDYQEGMIIDGDLMSAYEFSITDDNFNIKIDVYNQVLTDVPSTGISNLNLFAIGGLMIFVGYETIKIYRRKALN